MRESSFIVNAEADDPSRPRSLHPCCSKWCICTSRDPWYLVHGGYSALRPHVRHCWSLITFLERSSYMGTFFTSTGQV